MGRMTIRMAQPDGAAPWPERGHHLRIMTFHDGPGARHIETRDIAIDVGTTEVDAQDGIQVMRLFHSEGTWQEEQATLSPTSPHADVVFTLPEPGYGFTRPEAILRIGGDAPLDAAQAWAALEHGRLPDGTVAEIHDMPTSSGVRMATTTVDGHVTAFMLPWTRGEARLDARHYPGTGDGHRIPRTRLRCEHVELGMGLVHMAMNQVSDELPHVTALIGDGALRRMCADGDALGAMAIAHTLSSNRHQADPFQTLEMVAEAFPTVPDVHLLLAYGSLWREDGERRATDLTRRAIAMGPPFLTASAAVLRDLAIHLEHVPEIAAHRRLPALVDPGCLFTSVVVARKPLSPS